LKTKNTKVFIKFFFEGRCENKKLQNKEVALIFFSSFGAKRLAENRTCCVDGTFKFCPLGFYQLVSIISINEETNQYIPCCYILMNSKTQQLYAQCISLILTRLKVVYNCTWEPPVLIMDMELGLQNAFKCIFPKSEIRSCYFHFVKALWTHAATFGIKRSNLIKKTRILIQNLKIACHINGFPKIQGFLEVVKKILITENHLDISGNKSAYIKYFNHIKKIYFNENSPFSKHLNHSQFLEDSHYIRTNNYCEGYHRRLAQRIKYPRSRLTYVIEILKVENDYFEEKMVAYFRGQNNIEDVLARDEIFISHTKNLIATYVAGLQSKEKTTDNLIKDPPLLPDIEAEVLIEELNSSQEKYINNQNVEQDKQQNMEDDLSFFEDLNKEDISEDEDDNQESQTFSNDIQELGSFFENISIQLNAFKSVKASISKSLSQKEKEEKLDHAQNNLVNLISTNMYRKGMENKIKVDLSATKSQRNMILRSHEMEKSETKNRRGGSDLAHAEQKKAKLQTINPEDSFMA